MKWSEFKMQVDKELKGQDVEILYFDFNEGNFEIDNTPIGLIISEPLCDHTPTLTNRVIDNNE